MSEFYASRVREPIPCWYDVVKTAEGELFPVYRDWEGLVKFEPRSVYVSTMRPNTRKKILVHTERTSALTLLGCPDAMVEWWDFEAGCENQQSVVRAGKRLLVVVPPGVGITFVNPSVVEEAQVVVLADRAWHPSWDDTLKFDTWAEYLKWVT